MAQTHTPNPVMQEAGRKAWQTRRRNQRAAARAANTSPPRKRRRTAPQSTSGSDLLLQLEQRIEEAIVTLTASLKTIQDLKLALA